MPTTTDKVTVIARLEATPGRRDDLLAAFEVFMPAVHAEPGTEIYSLHLDEADENTLWVVEVYADRDALNAHSSSASFAEFLGSLGGLVAGAPDMYTAVPAAAKGFEL